MKIAFTGTHGTGKSTDVFTLAREMKIDHPGKHIRVYVDGASESPFPKNQKATVTNQLWVFTNQMNKELTIYNGTRCDILITDRTICDCIAYSIYAGHKELAEYQYGMAKFYIPTYERIILKTIANNNFLMNDGVRDHEDEKFRKGIEDILYTTYQRMQKEGIQVNLEVR